MGCFATPFLIRYFDLFDFKKFDDIGQIPKGKLKQIKNILNAFEKNPEKISKYLTDEKDKQRYKITLYSIIFYFSINFDKDRFNELLNNKEINDCIYHGLFNGL